MADPIFILPQMHFSKYFNILKTKYSRNRLILVRTWAPPNKYLIKQLLEPVIFDHIFSFQCSGFRKNKPTSLWKISLRALYVHTVDEINCTAISFYYVRVTHLHFYCGEWQKFYLQDILGRKQ